jgi:hypothetical protein
VADVWGEVPLERSLFMHSDSSPPSVSPAVETLEDRCVPSTSTFVTGLYTNLLHRDPQPAEVTAVVNAIDTGFLTPQQAALNITTSTEFRVDLIQADYQRFFGRTASVPEVNAWVAAFQQGLNSQQLVINFLSSSEFFQAHGGTNSGWLNGVYQVVLGRAPDAGGQAYWLQALQNGMSRQAVAQGIVFNPEALARVVSAAYQDVLGRPADPSGLAGSTAALQHGLTPEALLALLASSAEFINARGGLDVVQQVPVFVPVAVPIDTFVFNPFFGGPLVGFGGFTATGGFTGGFSGGSSG